MVKGEKLKAFINNRWLVLVVSMWIQSCTGVGYLFGSISPVIKRSMGYNQRQIGMLGVVKDFGGAFGCIAGALSEILPFWSLLTIGVFEIFVGYGSVWLIVTKTLPSSLPVWVLCISMFVATNGETYFNTATLVACVQNFPKSRGPVVGILKGFAGLSGATLSQVYRMFSSNKNDSIILMVTIVPTIVVLFLMFIVRNVEGHLQARPSDSISFSFVYGVCLLLACYLFAILLLEDLTDVSQSLNVLCSVILFVILALPLIVPVRLVFCSKPRHSVEESLLPELQSSESSNSKQDEPETILSDVESKVENENERGLGVKEGTQEYSDRKKRISQSQSKLFLGAVEGAVRITRKKGPHRGENFTLQQALVKADFWLIFVSVVIVSGSGITIFNNLGQICQSLGYPNPRIFVSMISIWNFLGRVGGGHFSELVVRNYSYPRPAAMAFFQVIMAIGLLYYALALPAAIYVVIMLVGIGYGAHWAIAPATVSELFGLKSFGALYNFLKLATPAGSLIFSGVLASHLYDHYAEMQAGISQPFLEAMLQMPIRDADAHTCTGTICYSITCAVLCCVLLVAVLLSLVLVKRTKSVYTQLYASPQC